MPYTPNTWQDRIGVGLNKFTDQNGNNLELTPNPDAITQTGTPFSAAWMNHIEQGIADIGKVLWESPDSTGWSSGNITIPGISDFTTIVVEGTSWSAVLSRGTTTTGIGNRFIGSGAAFITLSSPAIVYLDLTFSGDSLSIEGKHFIVFLVSSGSPTLSVSDGTPIKRILGVF